MSRFFNINEIDTQENDDPLVIEGGCHDERFLLLHYARINTVKQLIGKLPQEGHAKFLWTVNSFNAFTFIPLIIKERGTIDELIIATYSINIRIIDALVRLIDRGMITRVEIFISDSIRTRLPRVYDHLMAITEQKPVNVHYAWNHAKFSLIRSGDDHYIVEGSGNFGENAQHEQYVFVKSKTLFEFRKDEINGINTPSI